MTLQWIIKTAKFYKVDGTPKSGTVPPKSGRVATLLLMEINKWIFLANKIGKAGKGERLKRSGFSKTIIFSFPLKLETTALIGEFRSYFLITVIKSTKFLRIWSRYFTGNESGCTFSKWLTMIIFYRQHSTIPMNKNRFTSPWEFRHPRCDSLSLTKKLHASDKMFFFEHCLKLLRSKVI